MSNAFVDMWEEIGYVFEHGEGKHDTIEPFMVQIEHAVKHWKLLPLGNEKESGLPHRAHVASRLMLACYLLYPEAYQDGVREKGISAVYKMGMCGEYTEDEDE